MWPCDHIACSEVTVSECDGPLINSHLPTVQSVATNI
jgi:hypothetical protein